MGFRIENGVRSVGCVRALRLAFFLEFEVGMTKTSEHRGLCYSINLSFRLGLLYVLACQAVPDMLIK